LKRLKAEKLKKQLLAQQALDLAKKQELERQKKKKVIVHKQNSRRVFKPPLPSKNKKPKNQKKEESK
jgi:hypothetical protein